MATPTVPPGKDTPYPPTSPTPAKQLADASPVAFLEGTLERVTFHNEENGYTVARLAPRGRDYVVTIIGTMHAVNVGASLKLRGRWVTHSQYGKQFEVEHYSEELPATVEGIRRYLGSGLIKGVGPVTAERIVDYFGAETLDVIDHAAERLHEVPGVGAVRAEKIARAWEEQRQIKEIMIFLQSHGVSTSMAVRIYKTYGDEAIATVRDDPYRLAREVFGIGFRTADQIAQKMGLAADSPQRIEAGVLFALGNMADDGHVYSPRDVLAAEAVRLLEVAADAVEPAIDRLVATHALRIEVVAADDKQAGTAGHVGPAGHVGSGEKTGRRVPADSGDDAGARLDADPRDPADASNQAVYLPPFLYAEIGVANRLRRVRDEPATRLGVFQRLDWDTALDWVDRRLPHPLAARQREAVRAALTRKVSVLTGGPGTGKTTTVRAILELLAAKGKSVRLAAPTGRAAKRLAETTGLEAKTIHRLLEFSPAEGRMFKRGEDNPIDADLVVVDELSMVDLLLMNHLTKAVDPTSHLLLVGDVDQLPSVGAGNVLADLIASDALPTVALDEIFRQSAQSHIIVNAHRINRGEMPVLERDSHDFFLFPVEDAEAAAGWVVDVVTRRVPDRFGLDPVRDIQVLSPMHRGAAGVAALNERLQAALNPPEEGKPEVRFGGRVFRLGDKVMQIRNNYDKDVFNGDVGRIARIDAEEKTVEIAFEGIPVEYEFAELDELVHAFACSTHKSQGSEYPAVVLVLLPAHYMMLQRNLLYTGVTRARQLCVIVGSRRAIAMAVKNDRVAARYSGLARRLREDGGRRIPQGVWDG